VRLFCVLTGGGGLSGIDVADNDDVDVKLLLTISQIAVSIYVSCEAAFDLCRSCLLRDLTYPMVAVV
jgi:hypothetical protein